MQKPSLPPRSAALESTFSQNPLVMCLQVRVSEVLIQASFLLTSLPYSKSWDCS